MENNEYLKSLDDVVKEGPFANTLQASDGEPCVAVPMSKYNRSVYNDIILRFMVRASKELYKEEIMAFLTKCAANPECEV